VATTVTVKINKVTKAALDIYAAKQYAKTGRALTNDEVILQILQAVDLVAVQQAMEAAENG